MPPISPPNESAAWSIASLRGILVLSSIIAVVLVVRLRSRPRRPPPWPSISLDKVDVKQDAIPWLQSPDDWSDEMMPPWAASSSGIFNDFHQNFENRPLNSGDMAAMLELPPPSIRRHSYPAEQVQGAPQSSRRSSKGRIGSITTLDGQTIQQRDMVLVERGGWRRHAKVFGRPDGSPGRTGTL